jgi:hypothetical protein
VKQNEEIDKLIADATGENMNTQSYDRINDCAAVVIANQPVRDFKTRFDKPVRFQPPLVQVAHAAPGSFHPAATHLEDVNLLME